MAYNREELLNLPVEEKLELVEALWDRIDDDSLGKKLSQKNIEAELDRRIDEITKHPERVIGWEEIKAKMRTRD
jgi:putative addiction module component (TIGR02574 family)